jgi:hypothetical protein
LMTWHAHLMSGYEWCAVRRHTIHIHTADHSVPSVAVVDMWCKRCGRHRRVQ